MSSFGYKNKLVINLKDTFKKKKRKKQLNG